MKATAEKLINANEVKVELITGEGAHPEIADVNLMPPMSELRKVERNEEMGTSVIVDTNIAPNPQDQNREYWLTGYLYQGSEFSSSEGSQPETGMESEMIHELARCFMFPKEADPNGYYSFQINLFLQDLAAEGNMASEIVEKLEKKVMEAKEKIKLGVWEPLEK